MFTGIAEEIGTVRNINKNKDGASLIIEARKTLSGTSAGDSIAVNGVCLTTTSVNKTSFSADVMNETLSRSSSGMLVPGSRVNLERAMAADGRFGGHMVSGHIDGTGRITDVRRDGNAVRYYISASQDIMRYIVEKGSVALDGISLTVVGITEDSFSVSVIPHTMKNTCLPERKVNDIVNIENDIVGKYVEKLLLDEGRFERDQKKSKITEDFLGRNGFI